MQTKTIVKERKEVKTLIFGDKAKEFLELLEEDGFREAELLMANQAIEFVGLVKNKIISPKEADMFFTYIEVNIDNKSREKLSQEAQDLLIEGEHFCCLGKSYGTDLKLLGKLAKKVLMKYK